MATVREKRGSINVCAEGRKATIRNLTFFLVVYEHTIAISLSKIVVDLASFKVIPEEQTI